MEPTAGNKARRLYQASVLPKLYFQTALLVLIITSAPSPAQTPTYDNWYSRPVTVKGL